MRILRIVVLSLLAIGVAIALSQPAVAQIFSTLHSFNGTDGAQPYAGLIRDDVGNLYGTTTSGGAYGGGTVFKLNETGGLTVLHSFNGTDGASPNASLIRDDASNLYGTTSGGGAYGGGTVFKLNKAGEVTVLHSFAGGTDGASPYADLIRDKAGNLYGTTVLGGTNDNGTVFKLDRKGKETVLYRFTGGAGGAWPFAGLVRDDADNLYGTTALGGTPNWGTVFKLDGTGTLTVLHSFTGGTDGASPFAGLVRDDAGNLYGTTNGIYAGGTVFKLDKTGTLTVLYTFTGVDGPKGLIRDDAGNLYGITSSGGTFNYGTVFKLDRTGTLTVLYSFNGTTDGAYPNGGLIRDNAGNLYGTTPWHGASGVGTVFKIEQVKPLQPLTCASLTPLGDFYLNEYESLGLNAKGSVVGTTLRWGQPYQGFKYEKGRFLRLPTLGGGSADPRQINGQGQIIGQSQLPNGLWHATMWDQGKPIDLGTLGGGSSFAGSLNDRGDAAGNSAALDLYDFHAAAWFNGKPVNLTLDGEIQSYANGINNRGQVTGITNYQDGTWHSFIWKDGARTELPRPGGDVFSSFINNKGTVCGGANFPEPEGFHAYMYKGTDLVNLETTSKWWWSGCSGLNDKGHAVGNFGNQLGTRAFLWRSAGEGMIDLNSRIPPDSRTSLFTAYNVNEDDQITAAGYVDGQLHGFLLTPKACSDRCARAPSNLIAWWPGDGNATDIVSGVNGVTMGAGYAMAAVNKGFTFDGVDDYVNVPNPQSLPEISTAVTVAAWVNPQMPTPPAGEGYSEGYVFALRDPLITEGVSLYMTSDGSLVTQLQADTGAFSWSGSPVIKYDGNWKHIALTADTTTGMIRIFLNGVTVQDEHQELTGHFVSVPYLFIGQRQGSDTAEGPGGAMHYRGLIDEVQLFNRALAPSEILTIYQAGPKGVCKR